MSNTFPCIICGLASEMFDLGGGPHMECPRCGKFKVSGYAQGLLSGWTPAQKANLSGWVRENQECTISIKDVEHLKSLATPTFSEKANRLLLFLAKHNPKPGAHIKPPNNQSLISACWAQDDDELSYILHLYLKNERGFVQDRNDGYGQAGLRITPAGWAYIDELNQTNIESLTGFIAMWFNNEVNDAWKAIDQGIRSAGYEALRIDQKQHNNKIDDEIVAGIRRSKFLVADFTGHRGGVYFEAGLAMGLGLRVIWLCRKDHLKETHFDTRQYNFIVWEADKLDDLSKALKNRIEATIGRGPLQPPSTA